jgi:hypothetical protein
MSIVANHSVGTHPIPVIFTLFDRIQEKFANDFCLSLGFILFFFFLDNFFQSFSVPVLDSLSVIDSKKLTSLVSVEVDCL